MKRIAIGTALVFGLAACGNGSGGTGSSSASSPATGASPSPSSSTYTAPPTTLPVPGSTVTMATTPAPWAPPALIDNGAQSAAYVAAAGLPYAEEMLSIHYHAHLDININGKAVEVPPYLGFVAKGQSVVGLAPLHTHDGSGVIHIENSVPAQFVLGQVFVEWGVRFSATCIGADCAGGGHDLAVFVNGQKYAGDPTRIVLTKHEEIAIEYGAKGNLPPAPSSYHFPKGL
jgi:hypothetical protein